MRQIRSALPIVGLIALGSLAAGCPDVTGEQTETAKAAVEQAFQEANPPGRTGVEVLGKTVGLEAPMFEKSWLREEGPRVQ